MVLANSTLAGTHHIRETLGQDQKYLNHLGTVHAAALFSLAEATSGEFLLRQFSEMKLEVVPVVRRAEIKYSKPANGTLYSSAGFTSSSAKAVLEELELKRRSIIKLRVDIFNEGAEKVCSVVFDWFISVL